MERTGYSRETLWQLKRGGQLLSGIHYVRVGRRLLWHRANFDTWRHAFETDAGDRTPRASARAKDDGRSEPAGPAEQAPGQMPRP